MPKRTYTKMAYREPKGMDAFPNLNTAKQSDIDFVADQLLKGPKEGTGNYDEHIKFFVAEYPDLKVVTLRVRLSQTVLIMASYHPRQHC